MVHIPAKFQENTSMRFWVTVRKLNVTDRRTDRQTDGRGALKYLPSRAFGAAGDKKNQKKGIDDILDIDSHCPFLKVFLHQFFLNVGNSIKREENMKYWRKKILKYIFFQYLKNS